jgi:hypothetical protein
VAEVADAAINDEEHEGHGEDDPSLVLIGAGGPWRNDEEEEEEKKEEEKEEEMMVREKERERERRRGPVARTGAGAELLPAVPGRVTLYVLRGGGRASAAHSPAQGRAVGGGRAGWDGMIACVQGKY